MPDIRTVVKWHAGSDPGELLNMIGRAARDGAPARIAVCATQLDMRRPRTAPRAPTEALSTWSLRMVNEWYILIT